MATKITIGNKTTAIPDVYGQIKSGILNTPQPLDFGNVVIIDDGSFDSNNYTALQGVNGQSKSGPDSVYQFSEFPETSQVIWDSELVQILKSLFKPSRTPGVAGANKVYYLQASTTTPAKTMLPFTKGNLFLKTKFEGSSLNGEYIAKTYDQNTNTPELVSPSNVSLTLSQTGGELPDNIYYYKITALNEYGETLASNEVSGEITSSTGSIYLTWDAVEGAYAYQIYRGTTSDAQNIRFSSNYNYFFDSGNELGFSATVPTSNTTASANPSIIATSNELSRGLAVRLEQGRAFGYSIAFYRGIHDRKEDPLNPGFGFNEAPLTDINQGVNPGTYNIVKPLPLFRSPDLRRLSELKKWMEKSPDFKKWFEVTAFSFNPLDDMITQSDLDFQSSLTPYKVFEGATTTFNQQSYNDAIEVAASIENSFYLGLGSGDDATSVKNVQLFDLVNSNLRWQKYLVLGGYGDSASFMQETDSSSYVSKYYNSSNVIVVHGFSKVANNRYPDGYRNISMLEKASKILGRISGLTPQTPLTFKDIAIDFEVHKLKESEKEAAIESGILCTHYDTELQRFVVLAGINTLGNNDFLVNEDATSYDISVERIKSQLNREIVYAAKQKFFSNQTSGPNRNTVSQEDVRAFVEGFLNSKVATANQDNLIIRYGAITVKTVDDNIYVEYEFVPNYPVNKLILTGIMLAS